ncbi:hypothetical protein CLAIMM_09544, partial [Cladophialophora immunda]
IVAEAETSEAAPWHVAALRGTSSLPTAPSSNEFSRQACFIVRIFAAQIVQLALQAPCLCHRCPICPRRRLVALRTALQEHVLPTRTPMDNQEEVLEESHSFPRA